MLLMLKAMHKCASISFMEFEWDPAKAIANFSKHGIHFADAVSVLEDDFALTVRELTHIPGAIFHAEFDFEHSFPRKKIHGQTAFPERNAERNGFSITE